MNMNQALIVLKQVQRKHSETLQQVNAVRQKRGLCLYGPQGERMLRHAGDATKYIGELLEAIDCMVEEIHSLTKDTPRADAMLLRKVDIVCGTNFSDFV